MEIGVGGIDWRDDDAAKSMAKRVKQAEVDGISGRADLKFSSLERVVFPEAGYTKGSDGIYAKDGKKLSVRISTTAGNQLRETRGASRRTGVRIAPEARAIVLADNRFEGFATEVSDQRPSHSEAARRTRRGDVSRMEHG